MTPSSAAPRHLGGPIYEWSLPAPAGSAALATPDAVRAVAPNGRTLALPAFAGPDGPRARLWATEPGTWRWEAAGAVGGVIEVPPTPADARWPAGPLRLAADRRSLVDAAGTPAFFFADTAWSVVWKGTPDQWRMYLDRRAEQGFSVLQVNLLPWRWDLTDVEGNRPFHDGDPDRPNDAYFAHFDQFFAMAAERGLATCLMLIWGGPRALLPAVSFSTPQAVAFARYAVARYAAYPMLWSLSGDAEYAVELDKWESVGAAVAAIDPYDHPATNHLPPSMNWRFLHHASDWHDFHMLQTGHRRSSLADIADLPTAYYGREPVKAVVNGEPWYEGHPSRDTEEYGPAFTPAETRYAFWVSLLSGATMGHTYGAQGIWNWKRPGDDETQMAGPQIGPPWSEALEYAGAAQCALGAALVRGLPWWRLRPAPEHVESDRPAADGRPPRCAVVDSHAWLLYLPNGAARIELKGLPPADWQAIWFDPRTGDRHDAGPVVPDPTTHRWPAPAAPSPDDWVLVLTRGQGASSA